VSDNWICGNYAALAGSGIAHQGLSSGAAGQAGLITRNAIIFNEAFDEGAGIFIGGETPVDAAAPNAITPGVGNIIINDNLIQGNKSGDLGGGIGILRYNGEDVQDSPDNPANWYKVKIYNNMIVNNITGGYGGGISLFDAVNVDIAWNTIANNDSTATGEAAFGNVPFVEGPMALINKITTPMPAGIGVQPVSATLLASIDAGISGQYSTYAASPNIVNNIITGNFARYWANPGVNQIATLTDYGFWDVGIFGDTTNTLKPKYSVLSDPNMAPYVKTDQIEPDPSNKTGDPQFVSPYRNTIDAFQGGAALGNFIAFSYSPMNLTGDYHLKGTSLAISKNLTDGATPSPAAIDGVDLGPGGMLTTDYDGDSRPIKAGKNPDIGADEFNNLGDMNGDSQITIVDVLILLNQIVLPPAQRDPLLVAAGDVFPMNNGRPFGGDGLTLSDALLLLQRAMGIVTW